MCSCKKFHYFKHTLHQACSQEWVQCPKCGKICKSHPAFLPLISAVTLILTFFIIMEPTLPIIRSIVSNNSVLYIIFVFIGTFLFSIPTFLVDCIYMHFVPFMDVPEDEFNTYHHSWGNLNSSELPSSPSRPVPLAQAAVYIQVR